MSDMIGYGATVGYRDVGATGSYTNIGEVTNIMVPAAESELVENTHLGTTNRIRTYVAGMVTPGDWGFERNFDKTDLGTLFTLRGTAKEFKITFPDASTVVFNSIVTKVEQQPLNFDLMKISVTGRVSGAVVYTAGV